MAKEYRFRVPADLRDLPWTVHVEVDSLAGTAQLGGLLAAILDAGLFVGLSGELGSGKTELVRGIVSALGGSAEELASPSYVLQCIYPVPGFLFGEKRPSSVHHWDWYRLGAGGLPPEFSDERTSRSVLALVEWPERIEEWQEMEDLRCRIEFADATPGTGRRVDLEFRNRALAERMLAILKKTGALRA